MNIELVDGIRYTIFEDENYAIVGDNSNSERNGLSDPYSCPPNINIRSVISYDGIEYHVKAISDNAFRSCSSTKNLEISEGIEKIGQYAFYLCKMTIKKLVLPQSLSVIKKHAFAENFIDEIYIGPNLEEFDVVAFGRTYVKKIIVDQTNQYFCNDEQFSLYSKNMTVLYAASGYNPNFIVPSTVTSIIGQAIDGISIRSLTIPSSLIFNETAFIIMALENLVNLYLFCDIINNSQFLSYCYKLKNVFYCGKYNASKSFMFNIPSNVNVYVNNPSFKIISGIKTKLIQIKFPNEYLLSCELPYLSYFYHLSYVHLFVFVMI